MSKAFHLYCEFSFTALLNLSQIEDNVSYISMYVYVTCMYVCSSGLMWFINYIYSVQQIKYTEHVTNM